MFTVQGFNNWFFDTFMIIFLGWWELYEFSVRWIRNDWTFGAIENGNPVDKNRFFQVGFNWVDPYDFDYYSQRSDGVDCNGKVGQGNYCYCPSQGYICKC